MIVGVHGLTDEMPRLHEYSPGFEPERFAAHETFFVEDVRRWTESQFGVALRTDRTAVFGVSAGAGSGDPWFAPGRQGIRPVHQEPSHRFRPRQMNGLGIRRPSLGRSAESPAQVGPRRVREVIVFKIAARQDGVDEREAGGRRVAHRDRHGPVQFHDR
jgi:hypothetical protein